MNYNISLEIMTIFTTIALVGLVHTISNAEKISLINKLAQLHHN